MFLLSFILIVLVIAADAAIMLLQKRVLLLLVILVHQIPGSSILVPEIGGSLPAARRKPLGPRVEA